MRAVRGGYPGYAPNAWSHVGRYANSYWYGRQRFLTGCYHFGLHSGLWWPRYNSWGAYGLGFGWYGSQICSPVGLGGSFVLRWRSWNPLATTVSWWWPTSCYVPGVYGSFASSTVFAFGAGGFFDDGFVGDPGFAPAAPVAVDDPGVVEVGAAGLDPADAPVPEGLIEDPAIGGSAAAATAPAPEATPAEMASRRHLDLGDFYFREMRYDDAAEAYLRALTYTPDDGSIHFVAADALFASADYHYAAYMIRKGLELDPGLAEIDADKRLFYDDPATFEGQVDVLRAYIEQKPFDAAARLVLAYNLRYSGRHAEAIEVLQKVLEIEPGQMAAIVLLEALASSDGEVPEIR